MNQPTWQVRLLGSRLPWRVGPIRPADVGEGLCNTLLARENILEDANYQKIVPNHFRVEIGQENYNRNYRPLEEQLLSQWKDRLLDYLLTVNNRQGRFEYRFAGPVSIDIRPVQDLKISQARVLYRIQAGEASSLSGFQEKPAACLETAPGGRRWPIHPGTVTIGRDKACDVHLDSPEVQRKKLVSGLHAYIFCQEDRCRLFDGSPDGRPSLNGTFVNLQRVPSDGIELKDGDQILLAALDPHQPDPDSPGIATLYFRMECV